MLPTENAKSLGLPFCLAQAPDATSIGRPWSGITVNWHDWAGSGETCSPQLDHDVVAMRTSGHARLTQIRDGKTHICNTTAGNISLHPRGMESRWMWDRPGSILLLRMPQRLLVDAAAAVTTGAPSSVELQNIFTLRDPFVERIAIQLLDELRSPEHPSQAYITQSLSDALACHLIFRLNYHAARPERVRAKLQPRALQRVQDYIRANLHQHIDLQTLANLANVSRFHFARMFRASTGFSAMTYLEHLRMERAQELMRSTTLPLGQIARLVGYDDQSYFCKRFRLFCGVNPSAYARTVNVAQLPA